MSRKRPFKTVAIALGALLAVPAAQAQTPGSAAGSLQGSAAEQVLTKVQYYSNGDYYGSRGRYYSDDDWDADEDSSFGAAAPFAAGSGGYEAASPEELCRARFRSFDPETGTYTTYDGDTVLCPYLR
jgi:BA14K-like protein